MSVYAEKTFDDKPCKSTLVRASREAESPRGDTDKVRPARVSCRQKEIGINQANESVLTVFIS